MPDSIRVQWRTAVAGPTFPAELRVIRGTLLTLVEVMTTAGVIQEYRPRLAKVTGLPERTVDRHLARAVDTGWLTHPTVGGNGRPSQYVAAFPGRSCAP